MLPRTVYVLLLAAAAYGCDESRSPSPGGGGGGGGGSTADAGVTADAATSADSGTTIVPDTGPSGLPLLGNGSNSIDQVQLKTIGDRVDRLNDPRDLELHPQRRSELWVVNHEDSSTVIFTDVNTPLQRSIRKAGGGNDHFMARPSALAFGENGNFASAPEEDRITQPTTPADFMGPSLWISNLNIFDSGHSGHLDMLHNSPASMGIAWETYNTYWVFDGSHSSITRYAFNMDHGPGGSDHSDGDVARFVPGQVSRVRNVPSHMEFDSTSGLLYIADTGNNRIATLDTRAGTPGRGIQPNYDGGRQYMMNNTNVETWVDGSAIGLARPSGLAMAADGTIFVSDNLTSIIMALGRDGTVLDWIDTGLPSGSLMGLELDDTGGLYMIDAIGSRVLHMSPKQ